MSKSAAYLQNPLLIALLVFLGTAAVFWPVTNLGFINFDDPDYVTENPPVLQGVSSQGVAWAFTTGHAANWHPVTWLSHMLDCELYGVRPWGHHFTNLLLHAATATLLLLAFNVLTRSLWQSAVLAALFAVHPLRVESVAWIAERKDVLSGFFFALTLYLYGRYCRVGETQRRAGEGFACSKARCSLYFAALFSFAIGLMSKPMLVTTPFVLLLLDYWPLRRIGPTVGIKDLFALIIEKAPFFVLAIASSVVTFLVQKTGGAVSAITTLGIEQRIGNALVSCVRYLGKMIWPADLAVFYPHPGLWPTWQVVGALLLLLVITTLMILRRNKEPYLLTGWLWFLGMLVPTIGIVQVGSQAIADRYTYLPSVGISILVVWGGSSALARFTKLMGLVWGFLFLLAVPLGLETRAQIAQWKDSESLFRQAIGSAGDNAVAQFCLGNSLIEKGKVEDGLEHIVRASELNPFYPDAQAKIGFMAGLRGDYALAAKQYETVLGRRPDFHQALNNYAWLLATCPNPAFRDGARAVAYARKACELTAYRRTLYIGTLAAAYAEAGAFDQAVSTAELAVRNASMWGESGLAQKNSDLLEMYRRGVSFHEQR